MQTPLRITWEHMTPSPFLRRRIEREVAGLEKRYGRIVSCQVAVEGPSFRHRHGGLYAVRVRLTLPGGVELVASRNPPAHHAHEDAYVSVRDVFRALRRQLRHATRMRRDGARAPLPEDHGMIARLFPEQGYGFLQAQDGRDIYFHRNALLNADLEELRVGAEVRFTETRGEQGPQASSVHVFGEGARRS